MNASLVKISFRRDQIQFANFGGEHSTGNETREMANLWASECESAIESAGYQADCKADYGHDDHKNDITIEVGNLMFHCNWRGPLSFCKLTPAQERFVAAALAVANAADESAFAKLPE